MPRVPKRCHFSWRRARHAHARTHPDMRTGTLGLVRSSGAGRVSPRASKSESKWDTEERGKCVSPLRSEAFRVSGSENVSVARCDNALHNFQTNEVHYAELALAIPHDETGGKTHLNNHLNKLPPPPAYNYFDEPTIYAQIDHGGSFKTVGPPPSVGASATGNSFPLISPVSQQQQQQQQHHHHHPLTLQLQQDATQPAASSHQHHAPHTPHTPTTASLLQLSQPLAQHQGAAAGLAHSPLQLPPHPLLPQSPSTMPPTVNGGNGSKQYLREIVTVRTPLAFSQQESCV
uniref:Uncharacterized protein n=1 Tax=Anopheles farauti TaxID=69004 RepID=A0A182Q6P4_9DIPT